MMPSLETHPESVASFHSMQQPVTLLFYFLYNFLLSSIIFLLWYNIHNIKSTVLIIFKCIFQQHQVYSKCFTYKTTIYFQNFSSLQIEALYPLNIISLFPTLWPSIMPICLSALQPSGKESSCQCSRVRRHELDPWNGKIPWRKKWQPTQYCV